jgi:hypothetical protein
VVDIAKLNNYYYVINITCDRSQTKTGLAQRRITATPVSIELRSHLLNNYVAIINKAFYLNYFNYVVIIEQSSPPGQTETYVPVERLNITIVR